MYLLTLCFKGGVCCGWKSTILVELKIRGFAESRVELRLMFWELATADLDVEEIGVEIGIVTAGEIRRAGLIVRVVGGFEVRVGSFGKS
jgi:hypothetical protein